jgi:RNase P subunit RPR2
MTNYITEAKPVNASSANALVNAIKTRTCPECNAVAVGVLYSNTYGEAVVKIRYDCGHIGVAKVKA